MPGGLPILVGCALHCANKELGEALPVHVVVKSWIDMVKEKGDKNTLLIFDSYYYSNGVRSLILEEGVKAFASVKEDRGGDLVQMTKPYVKQSGQKCGVYRERTKEFFVHYWDPNIQ